MVNMKDNQYLELLKGYTYRGKQLQERLSVNEQELLNEVTLLDEGLKEFMSKLTKPKLKSLLLSLKKAFSKLDFGAVRKIIKVVPQVPISTSKKLAKKVSPGFDESYNIASKYIKSKYSTISPKLVDGIASLIATACGATKDPSKHTKDALKKISNFVEKSKGKIVKEQLEEGLSLVVLLICGVGIWLLSVGIIATSISIGSGACLLALLGGVIGLIVHRR